MYTLETIILHKIADSTDIKRFMDVKKHRVGRDMSKNVDNVFSMSFYKHKQQVHVYRLRLDNILVLLVQRKCLLDNYTAPRGKRCSTMEGFLNVDGWHKIPQTIQ